MKRKPIDSKQFPRYLKHDELKESASQQLEPLRETPKHRKQFLPSSFIWILTTFLLLQSPPTLKACPGADANPATDQPQLSLININNLAMLIQSDGVSSRNPYFSSDDDSTIVWGTLYPRGKSVGLLFVDGIVWGGLVRDGQSPILRVGGSTYSSGLQPGAIITPGEAEDPNDATVNRIWRYRRDWETADLTDEAFDILLFRSDTTINDFQFTPETLQPIADSLRRAYQDDLDEWPWEKGAPFVDLNGNGVMDETETPGLAGADQVLWMVLNDLDSTKAKSFHGSPSIGLEMQITMWAYQNADFLDNVIFKRYRLIFRGTELTPEDATIDSMYLSQWADPNLGSSGDDFTGCDTTLNLGFTYNATTNDPSYRSLQLLPPSFGYTLLQGPITQKPGHTAVFDFRHRQGFLNLPMTTFSKFGTGQDPDPIRGDNYNGTRQWWNILRGYRPLLVSPPAPWVNALTGKVTKFLFPGDPATRTGWLDSNPGDRRLYFATGPFTMALGDTQEVIIALVAGVGAGNRASVSVMKHFVKQSRFVASGNYDIELFRQEKTNEEVIPKFFQLHQNFPNPFNPTTEIRYELPSEFRVKLVIFNIFGQKVKTLVDERQKQGAYALTWDGTNRKGENVPSGLYFYKIELGRFSETKKMLLVR